jgi:hypothetical protein
MTLVFVFAAACEEPWWTGYALDPMQQRWTTFPGGYPYSAEWSSALILAALRRS